MAGAVVVQPPHESSCRPSRLAHTPIVRFLTVTTRPAPSTDLPSITVAICTRDRPVDLAQCLGLLATVPATEVLVVDSGPSTDAARRVCAARNARYVLETEPGLSRARNVAWREASGDVVAFLDDDSRPEPGWLPALVRPFLDGSVVVATGQILPPVFHSAGTEAFRLDSSSTDWRERTLFGGAGSGANMAFRRSFLEQSGGFDERIGRGRMLDGGEEHDAFYRAVELGFSLAYVPDAVVAHPEHEAGSSDTRTRVAFTIHLFVEYRALRGWLVRRTMMKALAGSPAEQVLRGARKRTAMERLRIAVGGCGVYLRNRWSRPVEGDRAQRSDA
jgi:GT2 family glycosyltransferase